MSAHQIPSDKTNTTPGKEATISSDALSGKAADVQVENARAITVVEHELGFFKAVKLYPKAAAWSAFFCIAVVMSGFDAQLITSFYALPAFQQKFGEEYQGGYIITAPWQTGLGMGNPIGQVVGALASGWPLEKFGRKWTLGICCVYSIAWVFLQFFSENLNQLCAGEILAGLAYGFYVVIAPVYASEVCPLALRGVLTASTNLAFVIGQFIAQGCAAGVETRTDEWAYKIPFAIQWIWPVVLLSGLFFAPESPYWLIRQNRKEDARKALEKLSIKANYHNIDKMLDLIEETDRLEREIEKSSTYVDCFRGSNLRRTEICCVVYLIQVLSGNPLIGYANYFFELAGLDPSDAFNSKLSLQRRLGCTNSCVVGVGNTALGFVGSCISWPLLHKVSNPSASFSTSSNYIAQLGRRFTYNWGLVVMTVLLFVIGFLDLGAHKKGQIWAQATCLDLWTFLYQITVGPVSYTLISEVSSTRLRSLTIAMSTAVSATFSIVFAVAIPYMLNANEANWRGKAGFFFGGTSLICYVWCFFRVPETKGRTFEELDVMFDKGVPARKFKAYQVDPDLVAQAAP